MTLSVSFRHKLPSFTLDVSFTGAGRLTALFGPSGCGKTTVVNVIAGLVRPETARVRVDDVVLADSERNIWLPTHKRHIGYVFQDSRLLPHLTVRQNLRYGRWFTPKSRRYADDDAIIELLGLSQFLDRRPKQLSGGEKQRVALGRAILQSPQLLLMDEPLASLDEARKQEVMPYIERLRDEVKVPIIYVSHSAMEVARLATDIVLMSGGRVVECGPAAHIMPLLSSAGSAIGQDAGSLIDMKVKVFDLANNLTILDWGAGEARISGRVAPDGASVRVHVRANDVIIAAENPQALSALNIFPGKITAISDRGNGTADVVLHCGGADLVARITSFSAKRMALIPGKPAYAIIKAMSVRQPTPAPLSTARQ